jgi:hypothetical protein
MKIDDIPKIAVASYQVTMFWRDMEDMLKKYNDNWGLVLEPDYQRSSDRWTEVQQIRYVEYKLRGGPGSEILHFNCPGWNTSYSAGPIELVDGLQRLTAVRKFLSNNLRIFKTYDPNQKGLLFEEFEDHKHLRHYASFTVHINDLKKRSDVIQWYLDLNSGGTNHTQFEINNAQKLLKKELENGRME